MDEFHYRVPWRSGSAHPGHHKSRAPGGGYEFHGHTSLLDAGDPRHLDIRASLSDPFGEFKVRQFLQTSIIPVMIVADLSASMAIASKPALLGRIAASIAYSAHRTGDPCGFAGIADGGRPELFHSPRRHRALGLTLARQIAAFRFHGGGPAPDIDPVSWLGHRRALVFLLSDFHFSLERLGSILERLHPHDVVPVAVWLRAEWTPPRRWGLAHLQDPESGKRRTLLLHPGSGRRLAGAFERRRGRIAALCRQYGRPPFFVVDSYQPEALSRYFLETCA